MKDEDIISGIARRDEAVIRWVINKYARLLWVVADKVLGDAGAAEDVEECVADSFIYLWQNPMKYDPRRGKLKTWLSIVCRTRALDRLRQLTRQSAISLEELILSNQLGAGTSADQDTCLCLREALRALREPDREILIRRYYYDQKPADIAKALRMDKKQVENRLYQTKQRLRTQLGREL